MTTRYVEGMLFGLATSVDPTEALRSE